MTTTGTTTSAAPDAALAAAVDDLLTTPWWQTSDDDLAAAVTALERHAARLEAARLAALAEAEARALGVRAGATTTAAWFAHRTHYRAERAQERVELATALAGPLAATSAALAAGDLTAEHALVVHRTLAALGPQVDAATRTEAEAFLIDAAGSLWPRELARAGRTLRHRLDASAGERLAHEEDTHAQRAQVRCTQTDEGTWLLSGVLDAVGGATVATALDDLSAPRAAADSPGGQHDGRSAAQRRAEALITLADAHLAAQQGSHHPQGASRARLVVTVPAATLADPAAPGTAPGVLAGGAPISAAAVAVLACDAEVVPVLVAADGQPLDVGRTVYAFPDKLRQAIGHRDQHCTFPSCTRPASWCQVHHLTAYSAGGGTAERNGTCLCGYHHRLVHRRGWRGQLVGARVVWHPPDRAEPLVPPPPWLPALERLVARWTARAA